MLPSTTKEMREPMYKDLAPLVVPGFLSTRVQIGGLSLGLRSLSFNDTSLLRRIATEGGPDWPFHLAAASIWMVDGVPLLESHPYSYNVALKLLYTAHKSVVRTVFTQALSFFKRMRSANLMFESFLYEEDSRRLWKATNCGTHPVWAHVGIPGLDRIGLNPFQTAWVQWNRSEDDRQDDDYAWSLTKVLVSAQSSKSAKKLDARDRTRTTAEKTRRDEVQNRAFGIFMGLIDEAGESIKSPEQRVHQPRTPQELSDEMRRWVTGEQDFHDQVVSDYKNRVKTEYETQEREKEQAIEAARERSRLEQERLGIGRTRLVGYTAAELSKLRPREGKQGAKFIIEANPVSRNFNRYLRDEPKSALEVKNGRVVYTDPSGRTEAQETEGPKPRTLNELISTRKPTLPGNG